MQLKQATKEEIKQYYKEEYNIKEIPKYITKNIHQREFAFDRIGQGPRDRYNQYTQVQQLKKVIKAKKPYAAYSSIALYDNPGKREGYNQAEFVIDVDAKDNPIRTCQCTTGQICKHCLEEAKEIILQISDNIQELGYKDIHYVYSGRGYHLRIQDAELQKTDSTQRTEILTYITAAEAPDLQEGLQHFIIPFGYPKIYTEWFKYTTTHLKKDKIYPGISKQLKNDIIKKRKLIKTEQWGLVRGQITPTRYDKLLPKIANIHKTLCDTKVTIDTKRILRLPSTLHYKVSMKCMAIKNIENFNPYDKAVPKFVEERKEK